MQSVATHSNQVVPTARPLSATIAQFRAEFSSMRTELKDVHAKNAELEEELAKLRAKTQAASRLDLPSLRRHAAYYCHPDRGGNEDLMSRLNTLFDFLTAMDASTVSKQAGREGRVS